jgi:hypothetical protein
MLEETGDPEIQRLYCHVHRGCTTPHCRCPEKGDPYRGAEIRRRSESLGQASHRRPRWRPHFVAPRRYDVFAKR